MKTGWIRTNGPALLSLLFAILLVWECSGPGPVLIRGFYAAGVLGCTYVALQRRRNALFGSIGFFLLCTLVVNWPMHLGLAVSKRSLREFADAYPHVVLPGRAGLYRVQSVSREGAATFVTTRTGFFSTHGFRITADGITPFGDE